MLFVIVSDLGSAEFPDSGIRLLWNWELNTEQYTDWNGLFADTDIRPLTYINPFFANVSHLSDGFRHDYFAEGVENGYFVMNSSMEPYLIASISIEFATVDLTNPAAVEWIKSIIQQNMINDTAARCVL